MRSLFTLADNTRQRALQIVLPGVDLGEMSNAESNYEYAYQMLVSEQMKKNSNS